MDVQQDPEAEADALKLMAAGEFKINDQQARIMDYIRANLKIEEFAACLSEEMWLREVLKDVESPNGFIRSRALSMWGQYAGWLKKNQAKKEERHEVEFGE